MGVLPSIVSHGGYSLSKHFIGGLAAGDSFDIPDEFLYILGPGMKSMSYSEGATLRML